ncbi:MAG: hypothetical protein IT317_15640 [Anaerolineales bacterium]|nr:hypothetical protein [Anaerolineales bacterium]
MRTPRRIAALGLAGLAFFTLAVSCQSGLPVDVNAVGSTAEALAQTAQAGGQQAGTALAHLPATVTALAATAQAVAGTVVANVTELAPTAEALVTQAGEAAETAEAFATNAQVDQATAQAAIEQYAQQVLGTTVTVLRAGGLEADIQRQIKLPQDGDQAQAATAGLALQSYGALLDGGAASVSYGSGVVAGDLTVDINSSSLGAFSFDSAAATPSTAADALALALQTFPALADRDFSPYPVQVGYAWKFIGDVPGFDPKTLQAGLTGEAVLLAVTPAGFKRSVISVVVGKGDFAAQVFP